MNRRHLLAACAGAALSAALPASARSAALSHAWEGWKAEHLRDGAVIDRLQEGSSHSEGQGYGMLAAALMRDWQAFDAMHRWTIRHLALRGDALLSWKYVPGRGVPDRNNATDGDLFHAWALHLAGQARADAALVAAARDVVRDLVRLCIIRDPREGREGAILLPAAEGFATGSGGHVVNLSYMMPRAMTGLAFAFRAPELERAAATGLALMTELAAEGPMPDWIELAPAGARPSPRFSDASGYEALRVPLWLIWSGRPGHPAVGAALRAAGGVPPATSGSPVVISRTTGRTIRTSPDPGYRALLALASCAAAGGAPLPRFEPRQPYYPATLHLLAMLAAEQAAPACLP